MAASSKSASKPDLQAQAVAAEARARLLKARNEVKEQSLRGRMLSLAGSYKVTRRDRTRVNRGASSARGGSVDGHRDYYSLDSMRRQCQSMARDSAPVQTLLERDADLTVGTGYIVRAQTADPGWNTQAEALFSEWAGGLRRIAADPEKGTPARLLRSAGECDIRGMMSLVDFEACIPEAWNTDGDLGILLTRDGKLQGVEAERIVNKGGRGAANTPGMVNGVEVDGVGRPVRYWVGAWDALGQMTTPPEAVPAESFLFLPNPIRQLVGSTRGEPGLQTLVERFEHLDGFEEAVRVAARAHACLTFKVKRNRPDLAASSWAGVDAEDSDGNAQRQINIEPFAVNFMENDEDMEAMAPTQPGPQYEGFLLMQLAIAGAKMGIPLPAYLLDARFVNLSTIRCVMQVAWRRVLRKQLAIGEKFVSRVYRWRVAMWIREGKLPFREDWAAHDWTAPPAPVMDPKTEVEAARMAVDARFKSPTRAVDELYGIDWRQEAPDIERDMRELERRDIEPVASPGAAAMATGQADEAAAPAPGGGGGDGGGGGGGDNGKAGGGGKKKK